MLAEAVLRAAAATVGVKETGRNSGPEINGWLEGVGQPSGQPWCAAWVYAMYKAGSAQVGLPNPVYRTASSLRLWEKAASIYRQQRPQVGAIFVMDHGKGLGHCGIVEAIHGDGYITTIEGNTNAAGSRNGDRVNRHMWNPLHGARGELVGYLCFEQDLGHEGP